MADVIVLPTVRIERSSDLILKGGGPLTADARTIGFSFSRPVLDRELKYLLEVMQRAVACMPDSPR